MLTPLQSSFPQSRTSSCSCTCASAVCYRLGPGPRLIVLLLLHYFCVLPGPSTFLACFTPDCCPCIYSTTSIDPPPSSYTPTQHDSPLPLPLSFLYVTRNPVPPPTPPNCRPPVIARQTTPRPARALLHTYRYTTLAGARPSHSYASVLRHTPHRPRPATLYLHLHMYNYPCGGGVRGRSVDGWNTEEPRLA
jgi:hypothetical protein